MRKLIRTEIKLLLPAWAIAASLPLVIRAAMPEDGNGDFALGGLGLGCAMLAAKTFGRELPRAEPETAWNGHRSWAVRMAAVSTLAFGAAAVFILFSTAFRGHSGLPIPLLAILTLAPALGIVPCLTLRTRKPFAAVVLTAFIVSLIKLASCVVVRIVYGPDALADGYMAGDWQTAKLMISLFWTGTLIVSVVSAVACRRCFISPPVFAAA